MTLTIATVFAHCDAPNDSTDAFGNWNALQIGSSVTGEVNIGGVAELIFKPR